MSSCQVSKPNKLVMGDVSVSVVLCGSVSKSVVRAMARLLVNFLQGSHTYSKCMPSLY